MQPEEATAYDNMKRALSIENYHEALIHASKLVEGFKSTLYLKFRAQINLNLADYEKAIEDSSTAISMLQMEDIYEKTNTHSAANLYYVRSVCFEETSEYQKAKEDLTSIVKLLKEKKVARIDTIYTESLSRLDGLIDEVRAPSEYNLGKKDFIFYRQEIKI